MGHFLYKMGQVPERLLTKYKNESKQQGKSTFHFAWAMDENTEERKRGVTIDIAYKNLETEKYMLTIMDAPGHRDFVPNMISGAAQADCALLIIDSQKNAFESGFFSGGQTREHATLCLALGVKQIIVVVNKMEMSDWCQERFNYIKLQLESFLKGLGFKSDCIRFVPVSGLLGTNLTELDEKDVESQKWYSNDTLLNMINSFKIPERLHHYPTRFIISDCGISSINGLNGFCLNGKVEGGIINENDDYLILPAAIKVKIRTIKFHEEKVEYVLAGNSCEVMLKGLEDHEASLIK